MRPHLLLVEDDSSVVRILSRNLEAEGFVVTPAPDGSMALEAVYELDPDLIILDLGLPDMDGLDVLERLRSEGYPTRVMVLTGRNTMKDCVTALQTGADDFVPKPFRPAEFVSRVRALLRRPAMWTDETDRVHRFGDVEVNRARRTVRRSGETLHLARKEYQLLDALIDQMDAVVSRRDLLTRVWGYPASVETRTVDTHIARLRKKLEADPAIPRHIVTVAGVGYMLRSTPTPD
ncbi:MAG: response regulator transcription factor [Gemmatimonadota bacterium]